jgi:hypothetical protein
MNSVAPKGNVPVSHSKINKNKNGQNQKPWFDQDCKFARQKYRKSKRRYKLNISEVEVTIKQLS